MLSRLDADTVSPRTGLAQTLEELRIGPTDVVALHLRDKPAEPEDPLAIGLWVIIGVWLNPCAESNETSPTAVVGIADAFVRQRLTSASSPARSTWRATTGCTSRSRRRQLSTTPGAVTPR